MSSVDKKSSPTKEDVATTVSESKENPLDQIDWQAGGVETSADRLVDYASTIRASDLFMMTHEEFVRIAVRHLGTVREVTRLPIEFGRRVISTIKASAGMDISDRLRPAEGRRVFERGAQGTVDLRVNSIPTLFGEDVTIRILDRNQGLMSLEQLNLTRSEENAIAGVLRATSGLILVTGPTGSGKTTTLYACIQELNDGSRKINTLEDPVEFVVPGVNQSQVNLKVEVGFPQLLASCLRQSPDVIMIGEIRDAATAQTAVRAANSGHLVLATLHAPMAAGAVQSMIGFGVNPLFLSSSLLAVVSQRLLRGLCRNCRLPIDVSDVPSVFEESSRWRSNRDESVTIFAPNGCDQCLHVGYDRRVCLAEVFLLDDELRQMISDRASVLELHTAAVAKGMLDFRRAAQLKITSGDTSTEEVFRVVPADFLVREKS